MGEKACHEQTTKFILDDEKKIYNVDTRSDTGDVIITLGGNILADVIGVVVADLDRSSRSKSVRPVRTEFSSIESNWRDIPDILL